MSAWQVSPAHIGAMVRFWIEHDGAPKAFGTFRDRDLTFDDAVDIMGVLAIECYRSVSYRYPDAAKDGGLPGPCAYPDSPVMCDPTLSRYKRLTPVEVIKACHCYAYQSCEHPEWETSEARRICSAIEACAVRHLPGYDDAPWGIDEYEESHVELIRIALRTLASREEGRRDV